MIKSNKDTGFNRIISFNLTKVPTTETEPTLGSTSTYSPENASNVPNLGLTMVNTVSVPLAPIETANTFGQMPMPAAE